MNCYSKLAVVTLPPIMLVRMVSVTVTVTLQLLSLLCFSYMRHAYGLGEHYNSVERLKESGIEEEG